MTNPSAVLVEDDPEQATISRQILADAGFLVTVFADLETVSSYLDQLGAPPDLFVLDRRLPVRLGETAADEVGDELLARVRADYSDARVVVFTGFASIAQVQAALSGSTPIPARPSPIDRVSVFEKHQSIEFKDAVIAYADLLQSIGDIEVQRDAGAPDLSNEDKKLLRRIAYEFDGVSIHARALGGGLTGAPVWFCEIHGSDSLIARVVAKVVKSTPSTAGLQSVLPRANVASTLTTITGLAQGRKVSILQVASQNPSSLREVLSDSVDSAVEVVLDLRQVMSAVDQRSEMQSIAELAKPLISWDKLVTLLTDRGITVPAGSAMASTNVGLRHRDLHIENVLVDGTLPVVIDLDDSGRAAAPVDPITLMLCTLVHPDSPIRGSEWPSEAAIESAFGTPEFAHDHPVKLWFDATWKWASEVSASDRELWGTVVAYCARQLQYPDVVSDAPTLERVIAILNVGVARLSEL